jgi:multiple sugar transport system substrate-binding protein
MKKCQRVFGLILILTMAVWVAGCGGQEGGPGGGVNAADSGASKAPKEPVTISIYQQNGDMNTDEDFRTIWAEPVAKKYPHITLQFVNAQDKSVNGIEQQILAGTLPDLIYSNTIDIGLYQQLDAITPLDPLIKQANFDLNRFSKSALDSMKAYGNSKGSYYGIPFDTNSSALYYNKDIFNKFGVSFPKDGMSWEEVITLSNKFSREEGGIQFAGLNVLAMNNFATQWSVDFADANGNATLDTPAWKGAFATYVAAMKIPGNITGGLSNFTKGDKVAMWPGYNNSLQALVVQKAKSGGFDWDLVSYPTTKDNPGKGLGYDAKVFMVSSNSKHKDTAMDVISVLVGDEVQSLAAASGKIPSVNDQKYRDIFIRNPELAGKNVAAIFKVEQAFKPALDKFDEEARKAVNPAAMKALTADINTVLREANAEANQGLAALRK